ncbi:MAG: hypothetical protein EBS56_02095 [Planctomycetia bacterium]|nr:hypothetical protein [Planctomycetia bacterium]
MTPLDAIAAAIHTVLRDTGRDAISPMHRRKTGSPPPSPSSPDSSPIARRSSPAGAARPAA